MAQDRDLTQRGELHDKAFAKGNYLELKSTEQPIPSPECSTCRSAGFFSPQDDEPIPATSRTNESDDVLTVREAAAFLKIHPVTLYRHAEKGTIPGYKLGSIWRFHRSVLEQLLRGELKSQTVALRSRENVQ